MKKITPVLMLLVVAFVVSSCSKEKRISRTLYKKDGTWTIEMFRVDFSKDGESTGSVDFIEEGASGHMTFDKSNTVSRTITLYGETKTVIGTWSNTSDKLMLYIDNKTVVFDIEDRSNKEIELKANDTYLEDGSTYQDNIQIKLSR